MDLFKKISISSQNNVSIETDIKEMENILKIQKIEYTLKEIAGSYHFRSQKEGFEVQYAKNQIETFFAYFRTKKCETFKGILPFGINEKWTLRTAVIYFGEPKTKSSHLVEIIYENLGVGLVFQGHWSRDDSPIDYCYFFAPSKQKICSNCKKIVDELNWICSCEAVGYCSQTCKSKHIGIHNVICSKIEQ